MTSPHLTGKQLLEWRTILGISQADLGRALGMYVTPKGSCPSVSRWETGISPISESRRLHINAVSRRRRWPVPPLAPDHPARAGGNGAAPGDRPVAPLSAPPAADPPGGRGSGRGSGGSRGQGPSRGRASRRRGDR